MRAVGLMIVLLLVACGDDGSGADGLFEKRETKREATERERLAEERREIEALKREIQEEKRSGLKVNLPSGTAQEIDPSLMSVVIDVTDDGTIVVADKVLDERTLENVFRAAYARDPKTQIVIRASRGTSHGLVVGIMEKAKAAGLTRLAIGTTSAPP